MGITSLSAPEALLISVSGFFIVFVMLAALSVMIVLLYQGLFPWWAVCVVAIRELAVDGLRLVAVEQGLVIPAGKLDKFKTNAQICSVLASLLFLPVWLVMALVITMSVLTLVSGIQYFYGARSVFQMKETERKI